MSASFQDFFAIYARSHLSDFTIFILCGRGGKCVMHHNAERRRVWDSNQGLPVGLCALWTVCPVSPISQLIGDAERPFRPFFAKEMRTVIIIIG